MEANVLYYGDNLDILRRYIPDESIDLIYLDPPFNSNQSYSAIFADESGRKSDAGIATSRSSPPAELARKRWSWRPRTGPGERRSRDALAWYMAVGT